MDYRKSLKKLFGMPLKEKESQYDDFDDFHDIDNKTLSNYFLRYAACCICNEGYALSDDEILLIKRIGWVYPDLQQQYAVLYAEIENLE